MGKTKVYTRAELETFTRSRLNKIIAARDLPEIAGTGPDGAVADGDVIDAILASQFDVPSDPEPSGDDAAEDEVNEPEATSDDDLPAIPVGAISPQARGVVLSQYTRRSDKDVLPGEFCQIEAGTHVGKIAAFEATETVGDDGYPEVVLVRLRDSGALVAVDYADIIPKQSVR